jgi:hypothetical protein
MHKYSRRFSLFLLFLGSHSSYAQTSEEIAAAKAKSDYLALLKQNADTEKVIAETKNATATLDASSNNANQTAQIALSKAQAETEKAQAEAQKSRIDAEKTAFPAPLDPTKYKVATSPGQPAVSATALTMMDEGIRTIANLVSVRIKVALESSPAACRKTAAGKKPRMPVIFPDDVNIRSLVSTYRAVDSSLQGVEDNIFVSRTMLRDAITPGMFSASIGPTAISSFAELALSYAATLKSQYGWSTVAEKSNAEKAFRWALYSELAGSALIVQPNMLSQEILPTIVAAKDDAQTDEPKAEERRLVPSAEETNSAEKATASTVGGAPTPETPPASPPSAPELAVDPRSKSKITVDADEHVSYRTIEDTVSFIELQQKNGYQDLRTAAGMVSDIKAKTKRYSGLSDKERNNWIAKINDAANQLKTVLDQTAKVLADLRTVPQGGISALDAAVQGDLVAYTLARGCVYRLATEVIDSNVDVLAKDGLLSGLRVSAGQATMVRWTLYNKLGVIVSTGVLNHKVGMKKVDISNQN